MADTPTDDAYFEKETVERREAVLKRMLATPPQPHKPVRVRKVATQKVDEAE